LLRFLGGVRDRLTSGALRATRALALVTGPLAVLGMFAAVDPGVVDSLYVPLAGLDVLPESVRARLAAAGMSSPERFLRLTAYPASRGACAERAALALPEIETARARVVLVMHRGIGLERAHDLAALGIHTREDLAAWRADA